MLCLSMKRRKIEKNFVGKSAGSIGNTQSLQKSNQGYKKVRTCGLLQFVYNENYRAGYRVLQHFQRRRDL